jgi:hypothetical protein
MNSGFYSIPKNRTYQPSTSSPYKVYTALLNQSEDFAPTAIVLENTLGNITYQWADTGIYRISSEGLFTENKTFVLIGNSIRSNNPTESIKFKVESTNRIRIYTIRESGLINEILSNTPIEIRVYN